MAVRWVLAVLCLSLCNDLAKGFLAREVKTRECKNLANTHCTVHNVTVEPCTNVAYCYQRRAAPTMITVDYTPKFNANNLKVSIRADDAKNEGFDRVLLAPTDSCETSDCVIAENSRRQLNVNFTYGDQKSYGNFPIQVKLWNADNEDQLCCFTYNVRLLKYKASG